MRARDNRDHLGLRPSVILFVYVTLLAANVCAAASQEQEAPSKNSAEHLKEQQAQVAELTADSIEARLRAVEANKDLNDSDRAGLLDKYSRTLQHLKQAEAARLRAASFAQALGSAPDELKRLKQQSDAASDDVPAKIDGELSLSAAQQELSKAEAKLAELQKRLTDLQVEPEKRNDRRLEVPKLQEALRRQIDEVDKQLAVKPSETDTTESTMAAQLLFRARRSALELELRANQQELAYYVATSELLSLQRDQAKLHVTQTEQAVKRLQQAVNERRRDEARTQAGQAELAAVRVHPSVKELATENADLAKERQERARHIEEATALSVRLEARAQSLDDKFDKVKQRAKRVGFGETLGLLLRKHLQELPSLREHRRRLELQHAEIVRLSLRLLELEDERVGMADIDALVAENLADVRGSVPAGELPGVEEQIRQLVHAKREYLDSLIADTTRCQDKLVEANSRESQLIAKAEEFKNYADQNVMWIRSAEIPDGAQLREGAAAAHWLLSPVHWMRVANVVGKDCLNNPFVYVGFLSLVVALAATQQFGKRKLKDCSAEASRRSSVLFLPTVQSLLLTAWLAVGWPVGLWWAGWRFVDLAGDSEFVAALGFTLQGLAVLVFAHELPRQVCRPEGLGESHFNWSEDSLRVIRRNLRWLTCVGLPLAAVVLIMESQSDETFKASLGRGAFILAMFVVCAAARRVWYSPGGLVLKLLNHETDAQWRRFERFWQIMTIAAPLSLALLAAGGFYYTATRFAWWMVGTVLLLVCVVVVHALMLRWLLLAYRQLAMQRARERRAAEAAAAAAAATPDGKAPLAEAALPEPVVSLSDVNQQTRNLLRLAVFGMLLVGVWLIWRDILPALGISSRIVVWPQPFSILESPATAADNILTLADIIVAAIVGLVTVAAARNLPGLLELTVLRRLALDAGLRNAVSTVSRYTIVFVGILLALGRLGIGWNKVQWLIAAMSVGLGFGLQEIFANFVSGLILLFERPIRIGDIVSVGDVTGKVSRIRIRATTITDWDMRELIVPNKDLITGKVMNWTLSDTTARMTLHIRVAYGADPDLVRQLLLKAARDNPQVLSDPPPHALLDEFGDSAINFTLRVYLSSLDTFLSVRHDLHTAIIKAFHEANIEIPFPQCDFHWHDAQESLRANNREFHAEARH